MNSQIFFQSNSFRDCQLLIWNEENLIKVDEGHRVPLVVRNSTMQELLLLTPEPVNPELIGKEEGIIGNEAYSVGFVWWHFTANNSLLLLSVEFEIVNIRNVRIFLIIENAGGCEGGTGETKKHPTTKHWYLIGIFKIATLYCLILNPPCPLPPSPLRKCLDLVFLQCDFSRRLWSLSFPTSKISSTASIHKHIPLPLV